MPNVIANGMSWLASRIEDSMSESITYSRATTSGTITAIAALVPQGGNIGAGTLTTFYGLDVPAVLNSGGGTLTNNIGVRVAAQTAGTNIRAIVSEVASGANRHNLYISGTAINYLAAELMLGTTTSGGGNAILTLADAKDIVVGTSAGTKIGTSTSQKVGFYNATPIAQRSGAAQDAVVTTAATQTTPWGFATQAQADSIVTLVNELRAWAVAQGFIKGSA